ncbi:MAG: helix-turn-helix domain-containing protein [Burkholderiaceae bacterium]|jgi:DNA-binding transcriptional regulator YdaS (Cro superfamily)|nr:helix-turn-helix domain-containing protein [Burkholderiaceae bacterium]
MSAIAEAIENAGGPSKVAAMLGTSAQAVCFWRDGKRRFPVEHCARLADAGQVPRWRLRPDDWHRIWPELIGAEGAPDIPQEVRDAA